MSRLPGVPACLAAVLLLFCAQAAQGGSASSWSTASDIVAALNSSTDDHTPHYDEIMRVSHPAGNSSAWSDWSDWNEDLPLWHDLSQYYDEPSDHHEGDGGTIDCPDWLPGCFAVFASGENPDGSFLGSDIDYRDALRDLNGSQTSDDEEHDEHYEDHEHNPHDEDYNHDEGDGHDEDYGHDGHYGNGWPFGHDWRHHGHGHDDEHDGHHGGDHCRPHCPHNPCDPPPVPEPGSVVLLAMGALAVISWKIRGRRRRG